MDKKIDLDDNLEAIITPEMIEALKNGKSISLKGQKKYADIPDDGKLCYVWKDSKPKDYDHKLNHTAMRVCKGKRSSNGEVYFYNENESYSHSLWNFFEEVI